MYTNFMPLKFSITPYNSVIIEELPHKDKLDTFKNELLTTITELKKKKMFLIWLDLPLHYAEFVPIAVKMGFIYHHADSEKLTLIYKIVPETFVPEYATHYIGAGGVVLDEENRLLVIQEKLHQVKHYKLPGGTLDPGEHISTAVCREVLEETGIKTEFLGVSCFRHFHGYKFGKSDIYFVCRLKPLSKAINIDTTEIHKAIWMPVDEYLNDPETHVFNKKIVETALKGEGLKRESIPGYRSDETHEMMF